MTEKITQREKINRGTEDSGRYFRYMAEFVGFNQGDIEAIVESRLIIEKHLPAIVAKFYDHLLRYPPTRKYFINPDGSINQEYLQLRMHHLTNFWRRTAAGIYDDDYARYVDYVGRAHTSHGADPNIYIPERYVIGQVGFIQHAITEALTKELREYNPDLEVRAVKAWNKLMMVILELLARAYGNEREAETYEDLKTVDSKSVFQMSVDAYEVGLGLQRPVEYQDIFVAQVGEIPEGERKIVQVNGLSIGVFHHKGNWYAVRNSCLHRGGPVATGPLNEDTLVCPWHGYQYNITNGQLLYDPSASLDMYAVSIKNHEVYMRVPAARKIEITDEVEKISETMASQSKLKENEFRLNEVSPGQAILLHLEGQGVAVYNVDGVYYATQDACTHAQGPLSEGDLNGNRIICPWHASCFDVTDGTVCGGPARLPLQTFRVIIDGEIGRVEKME
jgi:nitrite reductase/ring-hydroxylating ferredoxin subunit